MAKEKKLGLVKKLPPLARRKEDTHKGDFGRVLVLAGSLGMAGAACLCSEAVLRAGAGLVTLAIPESLNPIVASKLTCVITMPLPETPQRTLSYRAREEILRASERVQVVALGPGLSKNPETRMLILWLLETLPAKLLIDADGINALAERPSLLRKIRDVILTPHPGEMARLIGLGSAGEVQAQRREVATQFVKEYPNVTLVLKGHNTLVVDNKRLYINLTGNPGMASAGTGDVLTGLIAGLWAQGGLTTFETAQLGVYLHGLAGDIARNEKGETSLIATDVLDALPKAFLAYKRKSRRS